jgi:hypothetical protein
MSNPLIRIGLAALGLGYLHKALKTPEEKPAPALGKTPAGRPLVLKDGVHSIKFHPAGDINQRVGYIVNQIRKDSETPAVVSEARGLLARKCPVDPRARGAGLRWCVEPKDWKGEKIALFFYALTDPNSKMAMRYTRDHATVDMFGSAALMRRLPAGDCDDFVIRLGALLRSVGYSVKCRVVAPAGQPGQWAHIYLVVGDEPGNPAPGRWFALDPTEPQHGPFWEVPKHLISSVKDFDV